MIVEADDGIKYAALQAVLGRDASTLQKIFEMEEFCPTFHFLDLPIPFSFTFHLEDAGRPRLGFGWDLGDKVATIYRLFQILPLLRRVSKHPFDGQIVFNMGDEVGSRHIGFCSNTNAVLVPDCEFIGSSGYSNVRSAFVSLPEWDERSATPFWRGSSTGIPSPGERMITIPRAKLCQIGQANGYDVALSGIVQASEIDAKELAPLVRDVRPWQQLCKYRYNIDIDGNTSAWSALFTKLLAGGVVLKVSSINNYRQWYYDLLRPWVNFAPISGDMSDLAEVVEKLEARPELAKKIARNGRNLALRLGIDSELAFAEREILKEMLLQEN